MDKIMVDTKAVIDSLREIYNDESKKLSVDKVYNMVFEDDPVNYPSRTTIARLLRKNGGYKFRWESSIRPVANVLLNLDDIQLSDDPDEKTYKSILKLKKDMMDDLEEQVAELKEELKTQKSKYHERLEKETAKFQESLDFAMTQIELKDKRIDQLMDANDRLSITNDRLINQLMDCPLRKNDMECENEN